MYNSSIQLLLLFIGNKHDTPFAPKLNAILAKYVCFKLYVILKYQWILNTYFPIMPFTIYYSLFFHFF